MFAIPRNIIREIYFAKTNKKAFQLGGASLYLYKVLFYGGKLLYTNKQTDRQTMEKYQNGVHGEGELYTFCLASRAAYYYILSQTQH